MNKYPIVEMLAFFCRYDRLEKPEWRKPYTKHLKRVRSCHSKMDGDVRKSFYTIETKSGEILDLVFNEDELVWSLEQNGEYKGMVVDRLLALIDRHKHKPSRAHRVIPYRFEILPQEIAANRTGKTELPLVRRVQPYRFQSGKLESAQVIDVVTRHLENTMITKHLHYVVETDLHRFFHLVYILDEEDWRFMQEVDEEFFFVK